MRPVPAKVRITIPTACSLSHRHHVYFTVDQSQRLYRIDCDCRASDPEHVIMRAMGEPTCRDRVDWFHTKCKGSDYVYASDLTTQWPECAAVAEALGTWIRYIRRARIDRAPTALCTPTQIERQAAVMMRAVPRLQSGLPAVDTFYVAASSRHYLASGPALQRVARLYVRGAEIAVVVRLPRHELPPQTVAIIGDCAESAPDRRRKGTAERVCTLCHCPDTTAHRATARHQGKALALARTMLDRLKIPLLTAKEAESRLSL